MLSSRHLRFLPAALLCGALHAQVIDTSAGKVEFLGLESWSPQKLADAVKDKCKGHFCAATLKGELGFADAAVMNYGKAEPAAIVVAVVEPQNAKRVRYKTPPEGTGFVPAGWEAGVALVEKEVMALQAAVIQYALVLAKDADAGAAALAASWSAEDIEQARAIWKVLRQRTAPGDCTQALWCLDHDGRFGSRQYAAAVLMNFHRDDAAWWALADGLRDSDDRVKMTCQQALTALAKQFARPVDWRPAAPAMRLLLDGTNVSALSAVARALVATDVDPKLAPDLLAGAGHALLSHTKAQREDVRGKSVALLERLSGQKLAGPEQWEAWIGKL